MKQKKRIPFLGLTKPSQALQAMVDGLLNNKDRTDFEINMHTFGDIRHRYDKDIKIICCGCAATCALMEAAQIRLTPYSILKRRDLVPQSELLIRFESCINKARMGILNHLFGFFGLLHRHSAKRHNNRFYLDTYNWEKGIPSVRKLIEELEGEGL